MPMSQQQLQSQQISGGLVMQAQVYLNSGNPSIPEPPSDQSPGIHKLSPDLYNPGQPGPLLHYSPRDRMRSQYLVPEHNIASNTQSSSSRTPFLIVESAESVFERSSTSANLPEVCIPQSTNRVSQFDIDIG